MLFWLSSPRGAVTTMKACRQRLCRRSCHCRDSLECAPYWSGWGTALRAGSDATLIVHPSYMLCKARLAGGCSWRRWGRQRRRICSAAVCGWRTWWSWAQRPRTARWTGAAGGWTASSSTTCCAPATTTPPCNSPPSPASRSAPHLALVAPSLHVHRCPVGSLTVLMPLQNTSLSRMDRQLRHCSAAQAGRHT